MKSVTPQNVTEIILESISDGVFTVDHKWHITSFNRAAEEITGISRSEAVGRYCWEVFRSNMCEGDCALRRTMKQGKSIVNTSAYIINSDKKRIPVIASTSVLRDENGTVLGGVEVFSDLSLVEELRRELDSRFQMGDMVSRSPSMQRIFKILPQVADSDSTVLILGETGTGKELLARAIHDISIRRNKPFVAINCGALPDTLLESELFGYKAGAFTNAVKDKPGHFAAAEGGTIFLDEIGDISPAFQVRLLRVLDQHKFQPLGSVKSVKADVRVIVATNKDLAGMVENGKFRQDLFYRIDVVHLELPPLRDRKEDIPLLVDKFIFRMNSLRGRAVTGMDREALGLLMSHDFPGNIRELENAIEHAFVLCSDGIIEQQHLPHSVIAKAASPSTDHPTLQDGLKSAEARAIMDALKRNSYNRLAAARDLGMHKSTLFRKIKKLGIILPQTDGRSSQVGETRLTGLTG
ncbi:MAG: Fis family transcriptional regulator [Desulfobacterales bacterium C00003104]|nr:MAG: Fis family transcriptional regulator [Desulfobacterales bacterium C00003104]